MTTTKEKKKKEEVPAPRDMVTAAEKRALLGSNDRPLKEKSKGE